jgi:hypothetical protein
MATPRRNSLAAAPFLERHFLAGAAALLVAMGIAMFAGVFLDSDIVDESYHLGSGYNFLKTGTLPVETEQSRRCRCCCSISADVRRLRPLPRPNSVGRSARISCTTTGFRRRPFWRLAGRPK